MVQWDTLEHIHYKAIVIHNVCLCNHSCAIEVGKSLTDLCVHRRCFDNYCIRYPHVARTRGDE